MFKLPMEHGNEEPLQVFEDRNDKVLRPLRPSDLLQSHKIKH